MRKVLVHYHLFKNAGSSIDQCLSQSFGEAWYSFDPDARAGVYTSAQLQQIIHEQQNKTAFSSHCLVPPLISGSNSAGSNTGILVFPIIILREPISRVLSAYAFEWQIQTGSAEPVGDLTDYIREKFKFRRRNAIENFQTLRLAVTDENERNPDPDKSDSEQLESACRVIDTLPAFGLVERFDESITWLQSCYQPHFPELDLRPVAANVTQTSNRPIHERHQEIAEKIGAGLFQELLMRNQMDIQLYAYATGRFNALTGAGSTDISKTYRTDPMYSRANPAASPG